MFQEIRPDNNKEILCYSCKHRRKAISNNPKFIRCEAFYPEEFVKDNYELIFGVIGQVKYFNFDPSSGDPIYFCEKYNSEND